MIICHAACTASPCSLSQAVDDRIVHRGIIIFFLDCYLIANIDE